MVVTSVLDTTDDGDEVALLLVLLSALDAYDDEFV
jgi:hypothetical protein